MLYSLLIQLWFNNYESIILEVLYNFSPVWVSYISKKTKIPRSSIYTTLNLLVEKWIVWITYKNEVKQFIVEDLGVLERKLEEEKNKINHKINLIPELENTIKKIQNTNVQVPNITNYEWKEWLKKIYLDMLRDAPKNSVMYIIRNEFIWNSDWEFTQDRDWNKISRSLKEKKWIKTMLILNDTITERKKEDYYKNTSLLEYKFIKKEYLFVDFALYILDDTISMISLENNNLVWIKIINSNLAKNQKNIFMNIWKNNI